MSELVLETALPGYTLLRRGKVRDVYDAGEHYLIVATDRISAFDVVLPNGIPGKGRVLTQISIHWFRQVADLIENHLVATEVDDFPAPLRAHRAMLEGRSMLVKKAAVLPVECIVRGYLSGSGWKEYQRVRHRLRHRAAGRARRVLAARGADLHAEHQGRGGARRSTSASREMEKIVGAELAAAPARRRARGLRARPRAGRQARDHHRRHEDGVRGLRGAADPDRRTADAGLVALLVGGELAARARPGELGQADRARLPADARLGPDLPGAGAPRRDRRRRPRPATRRSTRS